MLRNLLTGDFAGPVYPVNPHAGAVAGVKAYPSVHDIPDPVDLAIVTVPPTTVLDVAGDCAAKGVAGLVVISAGFAEVRGERDAGTGAGAAGSAQRHAARSARTAWAW